MPEAFDKSVRFQEESSQSHHPTKSGGVAKWAQEHSGGLIKNSQQAAYVLIGFVALMVVISLFLVTSSDSSQPTSGAIPPDQSVPQ